MLRLRIVRCCIQSDSGRGLVCAGGTELEVIHSTIHHCSATGLYIGDVGTKATIRDSNIVCNGFGTRRPNMSRRRRVRRDNNNNHNSNNNNNNVESISHEDETDPLWSSSIFRVQVSSGHSGIYVERAKADICDCLIGGNSLTGLSVVRRGSVHIRDCDITTNGHSPIMVQDVYDEPRDESLEGGLIEHGNNVSILSSKSHDEEQCNDTTAINIMAHGGRVRGNQFLDAVHNFSTKEELTRKKSSIIK